ncbi:expressed protein [Batrachochytrium dendrobatidis JAM81]|uniref:Expressed protein n=1 Tax=Batrachochytrium dendrobatidis (strain JAM81 / FGSC 10211) TaxID=684364 RepID=F4NVI7_BATDJ|nr:uncharacterized protein BATDEDRAFT_36447 [Batrachochytrium dendrobatidis JAM81]EGF84100.1 expressed protein [Batrachochytrium dendrobatidis JAM81]|eukprot:XP_006675870.1 expressed protein [Batrachochytrium dendrobatidis JAM81]
MDSKTTRYWCSQSETDSISNVESLVYSDTLVHVHSLPLLQVTCIILSIYWSINSNYLIPQLLTHNYVPIPLLLKISFK